MSTARSRENRQLQANTSPENTQIKLADSLNVFDAGSLAVLTLGLAIGTPLLSLLGSIGAALTLGVRGGGVLLSLLVLPLFIPALVFGAGAVEAHAAGLGVRGHLSVLGAMLAIAMFFAPWATTAALRIALE